MHEQCTVNIKMCPCPAQIFRTALDSGEYVHIRNSLIILNKIVKVRTFIIPQMPALDVWLNRTNSRAGGFTVRPPDAQAS